MPLSVFNWMGLIGALTGFWTARVHTDFWRPPNKYKTTKEGIHED